MESIHIVWDFLVRGGVTMIPLALCSILGLAIVIEKAHALRRSRIIVPEIARVLEKIESEKDLELAQSVCKQHEGPFANIILTVLGNRRLQTNDLKELVEETGRQEIRVLERGLGTLETVASISPLLGLLGTVIGILKIFEAVSETGLGQASTLSGGLSEALITTIAGLSIGIPAVVFYNYFSGQAENLILDIEKYSSHLILQLKKYSEMDTELLDAS